MRSPSLVVLAGALALAACSRTPAEPAPAASTRGALEPQSPVVTAASVSRIVDAARCVKPTSDTPPPAAAPGPASGCPADPSAGSTLSTVVPVSFPEATTKGGPVKVDAELARSAAETERGLMYRTKMGEDHAMLFRLEKHTDHTFWMRNTCIPLDMLFVEDDGLIVGIVENVPTLNDEPRSVGCPSSWVVEVNAGWSRRHGVRSGQKLVFPAAASQGW